MLTRTTVELMLGAAGYCTHPERLTLRGGTLRPVQFPAGFAASFIPFWDRYCSIPDIHHAFFKETAHLPASLYRHITPVIYEDQDSAALQLKAIGIAPEQVRYVVLSHFHADHIGGVRDFPSAQFVYLQDAYESVRQLGALRALKAGFLPGLLPEEFARRSLPFRRDEAVQRFEAGFPFQKGWDLFGDGSMLAVELSGHAEGMIGIFISTQQHDYFLCADAVWSSRAIHENRPPHPAAGLIMSSRSDYRDSFCKVMELHKKYPEVCIVPSHCRQALARWGGSLGHER